jgi:hypothetical protein
LPARPACAAEGNELSAAAARTALSNFESDHPLRLGPAQPHAVAQPIAASSSLPASDASNVKRHDAFIK